MHFDQTDLAPLLLVLLILVPLFFTRRKIRYLESEEQRLSQEYTPSSRRVSHRSDGPDTGPLPAPNMAKGASTSTHTLVAGARRQLAEVRLDLAHNRMIHARALKLLAVCGFFLLVMLFI